MGWEICDTNFHSSVNGEKENGQIHGRKDACEPVLNPTIKTVIVNFEHSILNSWDICETKVQWSIYEEKGNWTNTGNNRSQKFSSQTHNTTTHC